MPLSTKGSGDFRRFSHAVSEFDAKLRIERQRMPYRGKVQLHLPGSNDVGHEISPA
jgi:hypothetical protein